MGKENYQSAIEKVRIPILVLDQKWHQIFLVHGKPEEIEEKEKALGELLAQQGKLNSDMKDLKKVKQQLMDGIVANMDETGASGSSDAKKADDSKRLIEEVNDKLAALEDQMLELPGQIKEVNEELMLMTMDYCYDSFRKNSKEIREIADWIKQVRHDLKVNVVKKQNREINMRQIYSYMNDIFGPRVVDVFDLENDDVEMNFHEEEKAKAAEGTDNK
jgi:chromosome segregation ATPase